VISRSRRRHPYFPDDLHPQMERVLRLLPLRERQLGKQRMGFADGAQGLLLQLIEAYISAGSGPTTKATSST
jgi:hypothetical protein